MNTKKQLSFTLCVLSCAMMLLFSCNAESLSVHDVEGEYEGKLDAEVAGISLGTVGTAHTVVTSPDNLRLRVAFENQQVGTFDLGSFTVDCGVDYNEREGKFSLYGEPQVEFDNYGKLPVKVSGEANGGILGLVLDISKPLNLKLEYMGFRKN